MTEQIYEAQCPWPRRWRNGTASSTWPIWPIIRALHTAFVHAGNTKSWFISPMITIYLRRLELGDDRAAKEYAEWVQHVIPWQANSSVEKLFEPMWRFGGNLQVAEAADTMFNTEGSPWNPVIQQREGALFETERLLQTPLVGMTAFRKQLLRQLSEKSNAGYVACTGSDALETHFIAGRMIGPTGRLEADDPMRPKNGETRHFRTCDMIARSLSSIHGFPRVEVYWPEVKRDDSVRRVAELLRQYGDRLVYSPEQQQFQEPPAPMMTFPRLNRVATADDVAKGLAIFSLDGEHRIRKIPAWPLKARLTTLRTIPNYTNEFDSQTGKIKQTKAWATEGLIWQAEEERINGKWQRWFGFVGPGFIGKAPAEEFEFTDRWGWGRCGKALEWDLRLIDGLDENNLLPLSVLRKRKSVRAQLHIRNVRAVDQAVPSDWYRSDGNAFLKGLQIRLQYTGQGAEFYRH